MFSPTDAFQRINPTSSTTPRFLTDFSINPPPSATPLLPVCPKLAAGVNFDGAAGALPITAVPSVAAAALGVTPPTSFTWDGLYAGSVFDRPLAAVTVIVDGMDALESATGPSYTLTHDASITTKKGVSAVVTGERTPLCFFVFFYISLNLPPISPPPPKAANVGAPIVWRAYQMPAMPPVAMRPVHSAMLMDDDVCVSSR